MIVGLISDTHDLLRPEAVAALQGVDRILHAGDVCSPGILEELGNIAPVSAVRGNCDGGAWARKLPISDSWEIEGLLIHAIHDLEELDIEPHAAGVDLVLSGHTHIPKTFERDGVIYVNPGSAGPRRFKLPISLVRLTLNDGNLSLEPIVLG